MFLVRTALFDDWKGSMELGIIQIPFAFDIVQIVQFFYGKLPEPTWKSHIWDILTGHIQRIGGWSFSNPVKTLKTYAFHGTGVDIDVFLVYDVSHRFHSNVPF